MRHIFFPSLTTKRKQKNHVPWHNPSCNGAMSRDTTSNKGSVLAVGLGVAALLVSVRVPSSVGAKAGANVGLQVVAGTDGSWTQKSVFTRNSRPPSQPGTSAPTPSTAGPLWKQMRPSAHFVIQDDWWVEGQDGRDIDLERHLKTKEDQLFLSAYIGIPIAISFTLCRSLRKWRCCSELQVRWI